MSIQGGKYLLFLGRLVPEKRIEWLIKSFLETDLHKNYQLVIAGDDSITRKYKKSLISLAKNNRKIFFVGYVFGDVKEELLSNCKALILPSSLEGSSISLMEALSYNKTCIIAEQFLDGDIKKSPNILHFDKNSYKSFYKVISSLKNKKRVFKSFKNSSYNWERATKKYESLFRTLHLNKP